MKKLLMVLGIIFICIIAIAVIGISIAAYQGTQLDKSSKAYVDEVTPVIISSWDPQEILSRSSPELQEVVSQDKLEAMFKMFSEKLGALKEFKGSEGDSLVRFSSKGKAVTASYIVQAAFEKADAKIKIGLVQHEGNWQFLEFRVNSEALMQ